MKAIMKTIKPETCANIMNLIQSILVIKNKKEATAIQKLIDGQGFADIYGYCSKINKKHYHLIESVDTDTGKTEYEIDYYIGSGDYLEYCFEGKVAFKFRCYKVEEVKFIMDYIYGGYYNTNSYANEKCFERDCCLTVKELDNYINKNNLNKRDNVAYALHISNLEIFDKPKELSEFYKVGANAYQKDIEQDYGERAKRYTDCFFQLTKAPQSWCYIESEK